MEKPLITSDLEPHRSVAGVGAVFVDPTDPQEIRNAVDRVIGDPDLRRDLIEAGRANINRFDPKKVAGEYAELYRRMIAGDRK